MRRRLLVDIVEALQVVASSRVGILDHARGACLIETFLIAKPRRASAGRCRDQDSKRLRPRRHHLGGGMSGDHHVPACGRLLDGFLDQAAELVAAQLVREMSGTDDAQCPRLPSALRDRIEQSGNERLPALFVPDFLRRDSSFRRRLNDDFVVDVEEAEALGGESADLFTAGAGFVRDADDSAPHRNRSYDRAPSASSSSVETIADRHN